MQIRPSKFFSRFGLKRNYTRYYTGRPPKIVVDVGANIGLFSVLARKLWPESTVYAYEPEAQNFAFLQSNLIFQKDRAGHAYSYPMALSQDCGELTFCVKQHSGWHSLYSGEPNDVAVTVQTVDFPGLSANVGGWIDFLKMDCEGCEWTSILNHQNLLRDSVGYLAMEYHEMQQHTLTELLQLLSDSGFSCHTTPPDACHTGILYARNTYAHCPG
jgi:FkbM family methyltransferase